MKKLILLSLGIIILGFTGSVSAAGTRYFYDAKWHDYNIAPIYLYMGGEKIQCDVPPILLNNSTLVPARTIFEKFGAKINWDSKKKQVDVVMDNFKVSININSQNAMINGKSYKMLIPPKIINDRTMIPLRFVGEAIGLKVDWDGAKRIVSIIKDSTSKDSTSKDSAIKEDINITNIESTNKDGLLRVTITSNAVIKDYSSVEVNDYPRLAIDIRNAILSVKDNEATVNGTYAYKIRAAQTNKKPNDVRVVVDLHQWPKYNVSLSEDKMKIFIDFDNSPVPIKSVKVSKGYNTDKIDFDMKYLNEPVISSIDGNSKIAVDIKAADASNLPKSLVANGNIIQSIECLQVDVNTARLIINASGIGFFEVLRNTSGNGFSIVVSDISEKNMKYENKATPKFVLKCEKIDRNYFNYSNWMEDNSLVFSTPISIIDNSVGKIFINDEYIESIEISKNSTKSGTKITVNGKALYKYKVSSIDNDGQIAIEVLPKVDNANQLPTPNILDKLVVIDPGHGGSEPGAVSNGIYEKDINLDIALKLYELLKSAGINVEMTRKQDQEVNLYTRTDSANKEHASLFVSVHNNAGDSDENGTMTLFYPGNFDSIYGISSERVAQITQQELLKALGTKNIGVWKRPGLAVLNSAEMPAILAEVAYVTNSSDRNNLLKDSFKDKSATALYNAIIRSLTEMTIVKANNSLKVADMTSKASIVSEVKPEDLNPKNINGFTVPAKASSKCDYNGSNAITPSIYSLTIKLDYGKELDKTASLDEQRGEAKQVLLSKLDSDTVDKIMNVVGDFSGYSSVLWTGEDGELSNSQYTVWVRCTRYSGIAKIYLMHK